MNRGHEAIEEEKRPDRRVAVKVLNLAKQQEEEKLKNGYEWVYNPLDKTHTLCRITK